MATPGYLFQTLLAATQARRHTDAAVDIYLVCLSDVGTVETETIRAVAAEHHIQFVAAPTSYLGGLHPKFGRLTLDLVLPLHVRDVLYLDGDTQVLGDLTPLLEVDAGPRVALAARDPMVFLRELNPRFERSITRWFDSSAIPLGSRRDYVNSGVLRVSTAAIGVLRNRLMATTEKLTELRFQDQDAINLAWGGSIGIISAEWNFPAFLLGTAAAAQVQPRIVHFMSEPRPWESALPPWGEEMHQPYADLVLEHPSLAPFWDKHSAARKLRYRTQQTWKAITEWPSYRGPRAAAAFASLEADTLRIS